ncbi:DUF4167 domain-containing protein [Tropicimonas isoalkanivorans]|uniref:DUF4167 domain-containing protein n=1 Tax=Tropicimonas isoalkanivorans TaxID=441112 RepID=UPI000B2EFC9D|nr:DUF4167 domain-containing protein [Tropicimonas isoalkanivorans]
MRSSKSRSRSKSNRSRSIGNIVNRVFDSSGPEGKVRGTPQQIIDKYTQLARDATLGNDRVAAENFQQHAEHYTRMLGEAQREQDARREQQDQANRDRQRERHDNGNSNGGNGDRREANSSDALEAVDQTRDNEPDVIEDDLQGSPQPDVDLGSASQDRGEASANGEDQDSGLVETPESKPKPKPRTRTSRPRKPKAEKKPDGEDAASGGDQAQQPEGKADSAEVAD